jgi:MFS family permease
VPIGAWIGADIAGGIADQYGWRSVFLALGVPGVVFGLLVFLTIREPQRGQLDHSCSGDTPTFIETMRFLWSQRSAMHLIIGSSVTALWGWGLMWWTPAYLMRSYHLSAGEAGAITGPIHLAGGSDRPDVLAPRQSFDDRSTPHPLAYGRGHRRRYFCVNCNLLDAFAAAYDRVVLDLYPVYLLLHGAELWTPEQLGGA